MQFQTAARRTIAKSQSVCLDGTLTKPLRKTETITAFVDHPSEWNATGTVRPVKKSRQTASLPIFNSMSTIIDKKLAVRVTNTTESPDLFKKLTQTAEFSVVTPEQSKSVKPEWTWQFSRGIWRLIPI